MTGGLEGSGIYPLCDRGESAAGGCFVLTIRAAAGVQDADTNAVAHEGVWADAKDGASRNPTRVVSSSPPTAAGVPGPAV